MPTDARGGYVAPEESSPGTLASQTVTATGTSAAFSTLDVDHLSALLVISAAAGTNPTFDLHLQTTEDGTNYYDTPVTFPQQVTTQAGIGRVFGSLGATSRWSWTVGGTGSPSFTFAITATVDRDD